MKKLLMFILLIVFAVSLIGCGIGDINYSPSTDVDVDIGNSQNPGNNDVPVKSISLEQNAITLTVGESRSLFATVLPGNATNKTLTWQSTKPRVAMVENGLISALSVGTTTVIVTANNGVEASCEVTVEEKKPEITLDRTSAVLRVGDSFWLTATITSKNPTQDIAWESNNTDVATVQDGCVVAKNPGIATIFAKIEGSYAMCSVTVADVEAESIVINKTALSLNKGDSAQLRVNVLPENAYYKTITWESSDTSIATVENGVVTAHAEGKATLTVSINENVFASATVYVTDPDIYIPDDAPSYACTWEKTEIKIELTKNTANDELSSGCERYYAGTAANAFDPIDTAVRARNLAAAKQANVYPDYSYVPNDAAHAWGANIGRIATEAITENAADIYCNFAYDLTCAQVRGCFANLLDTTYDGGNWFSFTEEDYEAASNNYFNAKAGEGYFYQYMQSLSLSNNKIYCLASNYTMDVIRSMVVVPVNVALLESIQSTMHYANSISNVIDFYDLVWKKTNINNAYSEGWTYDVLAHYGTKFYEDDTTSDYALADKVAFAAGCTNSLVSSALLYSNGLDIVQIKPVDDGRYFYYPSYDRSELDSFTVELQKLFGSDRPEGIITVTADEANGFRGQHGGELVAIREQFANNRILFGGIVMVGSLEDAAYQNMRTDGKGFGIIPVPVYKANVEYNTFVYNVARIIAVAKATTDFAQCSAFLDYNSRMSVEVLDEYCDATLISATGALAGNANKEMLTYIRNHVRGSFEKTYDDLTHYRMGPDVSVEMFQEILSDYRFYCPDLSVRYEAMRADKWKAFSEILKDWNAYTK